MAHKPGRVFPPYLRPDAPIVRCQRLVGALVMMLLATTMGHAQAPERNPWALLWLAPQVPQAVGDAVVEATSSQLAGMGIVLRVERPRSQTAQPPNGAEGALVLLVLRGHTLQEVELVVTDLAHGRTMSRLLADEEANEGAMSEAAGLIAHEAALAAQTPEEPPAPPPASAVAPPEPAPSTQPSAPAPEPTQAPPAPVSPAPQAAPAETPQEVPTPNGVAPAAPAEAAGHPSPSVRPQLRISAGYTADLPSSDLGPGHGPDAALGLRIEGTPWLARASVGYRLADTAELAQARMAVSRVPLSLAAGLQTDLGESPLWLQGTAGLDLTVWWRSAQSRDGFTAADSQGRVRAGVLLAAALGIALTPRWDLALHLRSSLYFNNFQYIAEPNARVLATPAWFQPAATLEIGFSP